VAKYAAVCTCYLYYLTTFSLVMSWLVGITWRLRVQWTTDLSGTGSRLRQTDDVNGMSVAWAQLSTAAIVCWLLALVKSCRGLCGQSRLVHAVWMCSLVAIVCL